jgi:hypothetical protein
VGVGIFKKASKGTTNAYNAFCAKKLTEVNEGMAFMNTHTLEHSEK